MAARKPAGLFVPEALVGLAMGLALLGMVARFGLAASEHTRRLTERLEQRRETRRALELIRTELLEARSVRLQVPASFGGACGGDEEAVLLLDTANGPVAYWLENRPARIWRGRALMRCGPSYGLDGQLRAGMPRSRVLLDGLVASGFSVRQEDEGLWVRLVRHAGGAPAAAPDPLVMELAAAGVEAQP